MTRASAHLLLISMFAAIMGMTACVSATTASKKATIVELDEGVTYFLPKRMVLFNGSRAVLKKEDIEKKLAAAAKSRDEAVAVKAAMETEVARLDVELGAESLSQDRKTKLSDDKAVAIAKKANAESAIALKSAEFEDLTRTARQFGSAACIFSYDIKLESAELVADDTARFVAKFKHASTRDDEFSIKVSANGLLSSTDVVSTDRTGDILVEAIGAVAGLGGNRAPMALGVTGEQRTDPATSCDTELKAFKQIFDPASEVSKLNDSLRSARWPFEVEVKRPSQSGLPTAEINAVDGLLYRTSIPVVVSINQCRAAICGPGVDASTPIQASVFLLPQLGPVSYVPMSSTAFVKTTQNIVFDNGMLTSSSMTRPSGVLEVVRIPVKIMKALISVPAELIKLRVDYSSQAKSLQDAYALQLESEEKLIAIRSCVAEADRNGVSAATCFTEN